jgi:hypothetical protein
MKESEFIELLNLYVDHEIDPEDAKRLEAEVAADPERREVYRQYCGMQKACKILAEHYQEPAEANILPLRREERRWAALVPAVGLALAACVAVVLVVRSHVSTPGSSEVAVREHSAPQAGLPSIASDNYSRELVPALSLRDFSLNGNVPASEGLIATASQNQDAPLAWIARLQVQPAQQGPTVQVNFKPNAAFLTTDVRENRPSSESQDSEPAETVAFHFQR